MSLKLKELAYSEKILRRCVFSRRWRRRNGSVIFSGIIVGTLFRRISLELMLTYAHAHATRCDNFQIWGFGDNWEENHLAAWLSVMCVLFVPYIVGHVFFQVHRDSSEWSKLTVRIHYIYTCRCLYIFTGAYGLSYGPVAWILPNEVLPLSVRSKGAAAATASNWINNCGLSW